MPPNLGANWWVLLGNRCEVSDYAGGFANRTVVSDAMRRGQPFDAVNSPIRAAFWRRLDGFVGLLWDDHADQRITIHADQRSIIQAYLSYV